MGQWTKIFRGDYPALFQDVFGRFSQVLAPLPHANKRRFTSGRHFFSSDPTKNLSGPKPLFETRALEGILDSHPSNVQLDLLPLSCLIRPPGRERHERGIL